MSLIQQNPEPHEQLGNRYTAMTKSEPSNLAGI